MNNDFKQELQEREFLSLKDSNRVILKWATGCGKSKMTIDLINHYMDSYPAHLENRILFVVAEVSHIENWKDEFRKWGLGKCKLACNFEVDIVCYNSLNKVEHNAYDVIVFDEAHHMFTEKRLAHVQNLHNEMWGNTQVYLLSATLSSSKVDMAEDIFGKFDISTVTLKDAIENEILPDPRVYVIQLNLDDKWANQEIVGRKGDNPIVVNWYDRDKYKYKSVPYVIRCTELQKNAWYNNQMEYWKNRYESSRNAFHQNQWKNLGSQRKKFLGELKTTVVHRLLEHIPRDKRFVCFCASVDQAEMLSAKDTISSRKSAKHNQYIIDAFNKKRINQIFAVGMITEGMNLTDIQIGIITQLDGKERLFIQKFGRSLRAESPVCFIFYYKDTQDEIYLKNALENIDPKFVRYTSINQINNIKL